MVIVVTGSGLATSVASAIAAAGIDAPVITADQIRPEMVPCPEFNPGAFACRPKNEGKRYQEQNWYHQFRSR